LWVLAASTTQAWHELNDPVDDPDGSVGMVRRMSLNSVSMTACGSAVGRVQ
jgi:hypothetical protein